MERTIRVTGTGRLSVKPDLIRLMITLNAVKHKYTDAVRESAEKTELVRECIRKIGFETDDLKTSSFRINTRYSSHQLGEEWKQKFLGYEYNHELKFEFPADNEILGRAIKVLSESSARPEFRIIYTLKDQESCANEVIKRAVQNSRMKAEAAADAAGVKLGELMTIDFSWDNFGIELSPLSGFAESRGGMASSCDIDIVPENIDISNKVVAVWSIV